MYRVRSRRQASGARSVSFTLMSLSQFPGRTGNEEDAFCSAIATGKPAAKLRLRSWTGRHGRLASSRTFNHDQSRSGTARLSHLRSYPSSALTGPPLIRRSQWDNLLFEGPPSHPSLRWHQESKSCSICMSCILIGASPVLSSHPKASRVSFCCRFLYSSYFLRPAVKSEILQILRYSFQALDYGRKRRRH